MQQNDYNKAFKVALSAANSNLKNLLKSRESDKAILNMEKPIRNYLQVDGVNMMRGHDPAPGNLTIKQYISGLNTFAEKVNITNMFKK